MKKGWQPVLVETRQRILVKSGYRSAPVGTTRRLAARSIHQEPWASVAEVAEKIAAAVDRLVAGLVAGRCRLLAWCPFSTFGYTHSIQRWVKKHKLCFVF